MTQDQIEQREIVLCQITLRNGRGLDGVVEPEARSGQVRWRKAPGAMVSQRNFSTLAVKAASGRKSLMTAPRYSKPAFSTSGETLD